MASEEMWLFLQRTPPLAPDGSNQRFLEGGPLPTSLYTHRDPSSGSSSDIPWPHPSAVPFSFLLWPERLKESWLALGVHTPCRNRVWQHSLRWDFSTIPDSAPSSAPETSRDTWQSPRLRPKLVQFARTAIARFQWTR